MRALPVLLAISALAGGGIDGRPPSTPDPRPPQSPESAAGALSAAEAKRRRKAALRTGGGE